jgi:hypothetical protein
MPGRRYSLPHLAFLQGFEAAARTLSRARLSRRSNRRWSDQTLVGSRAYFIIRSQLSAGKPQVREFAEWLVAEAGGGAAKQQGG